MRRPRSSELELAAAWLDNYEAAEDDPDRDVWPRVAAWVREQAAAARVTELAAVLRASVPGAPPALCRRKAKALLKGGNDAKAEA